MRRRSVFYGPLLGCGLLMAVAGCEQRPGEERREEAPVGEQEEIIGEEEVIREEEPARPEQPTQEQAMISPERVQFQGTETQLPDQAKQRLDQFAQKIQDQENVNVRVEAHVQDMARTQQAQQRANAVAQYLSRQGIESNKITVLLVQPAGPQTQPGPEGVVELVPVSQAEPAQQPQG